LYVLSPWKMPWKRQHWCAGWGVFCSHVKIAVSTPSNYACNFVYTNCDPFHVVLILLNSCSLCQISAAQQLDLGILWREIHHWIMRWIVMRNGKR
jgi:hypothetical protein